MEKNVKFSRSEELANAVSHFSGALLAVAGLVLMLYQSLVHGNAWHIVSFSIFGATLIFLYAASTFYHSAKRPALRSRMRILDHASIYALIAGTYTPFALVTLNGSTGWMIFGNSADEETIWSPRH